MGVSSTKITCMFTNYSNFCAVFLFTFIVFVVAGQASKDFFPFHGLLTFCFMLYFHFMVRMKLNV